MSGVDARPYSSIRQDLIDGRRVYVKACQPGSRYNTADMVRGQLVREAELLDALGCIPLQDSRLGVQQVQSFDESATTITTFAVAGESLDEHLRGNPRGISSLRALLLAGRWVAVMQQTGLSLDFPRTDHNPEDLVEHCAIRLERLDQLGFRWPGGFASRLDRWLTNKVSQLSPTEKKLTICHGDFGPYNVLWDGRVLTPIDFTAATVDYALADVTYLIHRLEMMALSRPWKRWPVREWKSACLRGFGQPHAAQSPIFAALTVRYLLSRLKKLAERKPVDSLRRFRDVLLKRAVRQRLIEIVDSP